jgi:hypothetical protein
VIVLMLLFSTFLNELSISQGCRYKGGCLSVVSFSLKESNNTNVSYDCNQFFIKLCGNHA